MYPIWVIFVISGIIHLKVSAVWVTVDDFSPSELANLTPQQEHALMLKTLAENSRKILTASFYYEILSISIGNNFFGFMQDKNAAQECNAIIKASFDCFKNLLIQDRVGVLMSAVSQNGASYVPISGGFAAAFPLICSDIDFYLKSETLYTTLRDRYKQEKYRPPSKIYHYGIAKSEEDEIKVTEELLNEPKMKPIMAHIAWSWISYSDDSKLKEIRNIVIKLAEVPDLSQKVQKMYEKSVDEMIPLMKHVHSRINEYGAKSAYFSYLQTNWTERLWSIIIRDIPDWSDYLECDQTDDADSDPSQSHMKQLMSRHCGRTQITQGSIFTDVWPVTSDFNRSELEHLTQQQEHNLFLTKLVKKNSTLVQKFMYLELLAKSIGHDFFGLTKDESNNSRNNVIAKAMFECISNLKLQNRVVDIFSAAIKNNSESVKKTSDISTGFSQVCSNMDDMFKSETVYTTRRDKYMKQKLTSPKTTYQYGIGKPAEDQIKIIGKLLNDPALRKYWAHSIWVNKNSGTSSKPAVEKAKSTILDLAKLPSKSEAVQKLYEQVVEEFVPLIHDFSYIHIFQNLNSPGAQIIGYNEKDLIQHKTVMLNLMISKINKDSDLATIFKAFYKRNSET